MDKRPLLIRGGKIRVSKKSDHIVMDSPLFIRSLEWAREDAKTDPQLHSFTEKALKKPRRRETLTMRDYPRLVKKST